MLLYKDIEKYIADMLNSMLGSEAMSFGFSEDSTKNVIVERQAVANMPDNQTVVTFRVDNYDSWRSRRYGHATAYYDANGAEHIWELRTMRIYVNVMSKNLGDAFDASRFIIANLQNNRYNEFVRQKGRLLGLEHISPMKNLSDLENGLWTERIYFELEVDFKDEIVVNDPTLFVKTPSSLGDMPNSVDIATTLKN